MIDVIAAEYNHQKVRMICCDLSKAFDKVCLETLLEKLHFYGIRRVLYKIIMSYLSERKKKVSHTKIIQIGVPQGSILGPTLFIISINDISSLTTAHGVPTCR